MELEAFGVRGFDRITGFVGLEKSKKVKYA
jgi:hypothetical protein